MSESNQQQPNSGEKQSSSQNANKSPNRNRNRNRKRRPRSGTPKSNERDARKNKNANGAQRDEQKPQGKNRNRNRNRNCNRNKNGNSAPSNREGGSKKGKRQPQGKSQKQGKNNRPQTKKNTTPPQKTGLVTRILIALGLKKPTSHAPKTPRQQEIRRRTKQEAERQMKIENGDIKEQPRVPKEKKTNKLYISNLSYDVTEQDISDLFRGIGKVRSVEIIYNGETHRSKGFGFIKMNTIEEAELAIEILDDQFFMGRKMQIKPAEQKQPSQPKEVPASNPS